MTRWFGRSSPGEDPEGVGSPFGVVARHVLAHFQARTLLFAVETREAFREISARSLHVAAGGMLLVIGYLLLLICAIPLLAEAWQTRWQYVGLGCAGLHLTAGGFILRQARSALSTPLFANTLNELEKDRQWLTRTPQDSPTRRN